MQKIQYQEKSTEGNISYEIDEIKKTSAFSSLNASLWANIDLNSSIEIPNNVVSKFSTENYQTNLFQLISSIQTKIMKRSRRAMELLALPSAFFKAGLDVISDALVHDLGLNLNNIVAALVESVNKNSDSDSEDIEEYLKSFKMTPKFSFSLSMTAQ